MKNKKARPVRKSGQLRSSQQSYLVASFALIFLASVIVLEIGYPYWYMLLIAREDSPGQYMTSIAYLVSAVVAATISSTYLKMNSRILAYAYVFLSIGMLFVAIEEISWGSGYSA